MDKDNELTEIERKIIQLYDKDMTVLQNAEKIAKIFGKSLWTIKNAIVRIRKNRHIVSRKKKLNKKAENIIKALIEKDPYIKNTEIKAQLEDHNIYACLDTVGEMCHTIR